MQMEYKNIMKDSFSKLPKIQKKEISKHKQCKWNIKI